MTIKKVLIANRGEIAVRIIRTLKNLGLYSVAVYSDADRTSPFVEKADEAVLLPNGYLDQETIISKAKAMNVDAIHPGYGFLSENAEFSKKVKEAGIKWIGPNSETIVLMGDKINSKNFCEKEGVPTLPKSSRVADAKKIGFPILVKASAGGGGKGMRIVHKEADLAEALSGAKREAKSSFDDGRVFLEKYIANSRHIEVQILGDKYGNVVHLGERECSIQRRHQKIIEESPSPRLNNELREKITQTAVYLCEKLKYESAGTVEFIFDEDTNEFWFLEVNTRLQVEHPVTEMVTGIDLVKEQISIADGNKLNFIQNDIHSNGHAIEARLYAENPENNFLPEIGKISRLFYPNNNGIRWDTGIESGSEVSPKYDPMLAKVISFGEDRIQAANLLAKELRNTQLAGVITNKDFLINCLENKSFLKGKTTSDFISREEKKLFTTFDKKEMDCLMKLAAVWLQHSTLKDNSNLNFLPRNWTNGRLSKPTVKFSHSDEEFCYEYENISEAVKISRKLFERISASTITNVICEENSIRCEIDEKFVSAEVSYYQNELTINGGNGDLSLKVMPKFSDPTEVEIEGSLTAPMPGKILNINVKKGSKVSTGDTLIILEAMKMEHAIKASSDGVVSNLYVSAGDQVESGASLMKID
jgi:propionyl-CoA carboxylase alpha chain